MTLEGPLAPFLVALRRQEKERSLGTSQLSKQQSQKKQKITLKVLNLISIP